MLHKSILVTVKPILAPLQNILPIFTQMQKNLWFPSWIKFLFSKQNAPKWDLI